MVLRIPATLLAALWAIVALPSIAATEPLLDFAIPSGVNAAIVVGSDKTPPPSAAAAFDIDPDGLPTVIDGATLKLFSSGQQLLALETPRIDDFAWMRDGRLMLVTETRLASVSGNAVVLSLDLPTRGMRVRPAGDNTAYIFGGTDPAISRDVYLFARDRTITKLISLPVPVAAVAGNGRTTYIAAEKTILRVAFNEPVRAVLQTQDPVIALETGPNDSLFYATRSGIGYLDAAGRAAEFIRGDGGILRARGSLLFVLLSSGTVLRLGPMEKFAALFEPLDSEIAAKPEDERVQSSALLAEIAERLYELNFDPGRRDGGFDDATAAAIREYERVSGRAETGKPTYGVLKALRAAGHREPWGSIVLAKDAGKWGMGWGHRSRKAAVASAIASCGDPARCATELSFFGSDCAAFAYSSKDWSLSASDSNSAAREAALTQCQQHGSKCNVIATVCADGSNRWQAGQ